MSEEQSSLNLALSQVFSVSGGHNKLVVGFRQVASILQREKPVFVCIAKDMQNQANDVLLALCKKHQVPVIFIETRKELATLAHRRGKCGVLAMMDFVFSTTGKSFVTNLLKDMANK
ncbi:40S ribosomal S12 [Tubulinosema ratisbonensis]|uniref:40S ribosomal S12 n=1 Tax=Tubulinosema ratisbonensis TaxID=291195 RepID=A0A437APD0_9MICR|nr:40S ribosomal S12 [Tubulinosema ratisbonensis]